jgi:hypothetical protein
MVKGRGISENAGEEATDPIGDDGDGTFEITILLIALKKL